MCGPLGQPSTHCKSKTKKGLLYLCYNFNFNFILLMLIFIFAYSLTGLSPFGGSTEQEVLQSTIQYRWQEVDGLSPDAKDFLSKILIRNQK